MLLNLLYIFINCIKTPRRLKSHWYQRRDHRTVYSPLKQNSVTLYRNKNQITLVKHRNTLNDTYQREYFQNNDNQQDQRINRSFNVSPESCRTSCLAALDLESRTRSVRRPLPAEKPIQELDLLLLLLQQKKRSLQPELKQWLADFDCPASIHIVFNRNTSNRETPWPLFHLSIFRLRYKSHFVNVFRGRQV